eukprot:153203_1
MQYPGSVHTPGSRFYPAFNRNPGLAHNPGLSHNRRSPASYPLMKHSKSAFAPKIRRNSAQILRRNPPPQHYKPKPRLITNRKPNSYHKTDKSKITNSASEYTMPKMPSVYEFLNKSPSQPTNSGSRIQDRANSAINRTKTNVHGNIPDPLVSHLVSMGNPILNSFHKQLTSELIHPLNPNSNITVRNRSNSVPNIEYIHPPKLNSNYRDGANFGTNVPKPESFNLTPFMPRQRETIDLTKSSQFDHHP